MPKFSVSEAADYLGVSADTLRRWEEEGKLIPERTKGGHRRYDVAQLIGKDDDVGLTVLYGRVSTHPQKKDLARQVAVLEASAKIHGWNNTQTIKDIGSGINYKKRGLNKLLNLLIEGKVRRLVLTNKDRLLRFGAELVFSICELQGVEVVILNKSPDQSPESELVQDVLEVVTVFSAKLHSMRARQNVEFLEENLGELSGQVEKT
ncbi:MAG: IS607 family transposase [Moorea sp. SIO3C2]|nr:IS607 family transposase [Moorena sp. SIO3C2]